MPGFRYDAEPAGTDYDVPDDPYWNDAMDLKGYRGVQTLGVERVALVIEFVEV